MSNNKVNNIPFLSHFTYDSAVSKEGGSVDSTATVTILSVATDMWTRPSEECDNNNNCLELSKWIQFWWFCLMQYLSSSYQSDSRNSHKYSKDVNRWRDIRSFALCSANTLLRMRVFQASWIHVRPCNGSLMSHCSRDVFAFSPELLQINEVILQDDVLYVIPALAYELGLGSFPIGSVGREFRVFPKVNISPACISNGEESQSLYHHSMISKLILYPVQLATLSAKYSATIQQEAIEHYFRIPRYVRTGDVLCIKLFPLRAKVEEVIDVLSDSVDDVAPSYLSAYVYYYAEISSGDTSQDQDGVTIPKTTTFSLELTSAHYLDGHLPPYVQSFDDSEFLFFESEDVQAIFTLPLAPAAALTALFDKIPVYHRIKQSLSEMIELCGSQTPLQQFVTGLTKPMSLCYRSLLLQGGDENWVSLFLQNASQECLGFQYVPVNCYALPVEDIASLLRVVAKNSCAVVLHLRNFEALLTVASPGEDSEELAKVRTLSVVTWLQGVLSTPYDSCGRRLLCKKKIGLLVVLSTQLTVIPVALRNLVEVVIPVPYPSKMECESVLGFMGTFVKFAPELNLKLCLERGCSQDSSGGIPFSGLIHCVLNSAQSVAVDSKISKVSGSNALVITEQALQNSLALCCKVQEKLAKVSKGTNAEFEGVVSHVEWEDIGGLGSAKQEILEIIELPRKFRQLFYGTQNPGAARRRRSGVLLYGPPGCGKTLLAKAVASQCQMKFLNVKGPELVNMYVGESERNVRELFAQARQLSPCVIFFDELDSLAPARGAHGDSGGVMDRVVSQLLAEMDGCASDASTKGKGSRSSTIQGGTARLSGTEVFVIGATNRPDLLDSSFLRPGRLDRQVYVGCSDSIEEQLLVIQAQLRKFTLAEDVNLRDILVGIPFTWTGADFHALAVNALTLAVRCTIHQAYVRDGGSQSGYCWKNPKKAQSLSAKASDVVVTFQDLVEAKGLIKPSVTQKELMDYMMIRSSMQK